MSRIRRTNQKTFLDIYSSYEDFTNDFTNVFSMFKPSDLSDDYIKKCYWLLVAKYGDLAISGYNDETRWKLRLFALINEYGPEWQAKNELQKQLRSYDLDKFKEGSKAIYNSALNPNTEPSDATLDELQYINSQNVSSRKLSDVDAITKKWSMLSDGLDERFLSHFNKLFSKFLLTDVPLYIYGSEDNSDE